MTQKKRKSEKSESIALVETINNRYLNIYKSNYIKLKYKIVIYIIFF